MRSFKLPTKLLYFSIGIKELNRTPKLRKITTHVVKENKHYYITNKRYLDIRKNPSTIRQVE